MSLGVVIKGPEGIVLASDSRVTLQAQRKGGPPLHVNFDNATKLLSFSDPHDYVGAVTYGAAIIGLRTAHSFVPELEVELGGERLDVHEYAERLSEFFLKQLRKEHPNDYSGPSMMFVVAGYDPGDAYGKVYLIDVPRHPTPVERNPGDTNFGMTWGGQLEIAARLIHGYDPAIPKMIQAELNLKDEEIDGLVEVLRRNLEFSIPYRVLPLQDCVNLANFMIRTTISAQNLSIGVRGVGGPIDVAVIRKTNGLKHIQAKPLNISDEYQ